MTYIYLVTFGKETKNNVLVGVSSQPYAYHNSFDIENNPNACIISRIYKLDDAYTYEEVITNFCGPFLQFKHGTNFYVPIENVVEYFDSVCKIRKGMRCIFNINNQNNNSNKATNIKHIKIGDLCRKVFQYNKLKSITLLGVEYETSGIDDALNTIYYNLYEMNPQKFRFVAHDKVFDGFFIFSEPSDENKAKYKEIDDSSIFYASNISLSEQEKIIKSLLRKTRLNIPESKLTFDFLQ